MSASDDQNSGKRAPSRQQRERVLQPGTLPLARLVATIFDYAERESPVLLERLGGKSQRASGDLDGLVAGLGKAIRDRDPEIRIAAVHTLGRLGQESKAYSGDITAAADAAVTALSAALTDSDSGVREAVLASLSSYPSMATPALVDRMSRAAEDPEPRVRRASIAALRAFGAQFPLPVVAALVRVIAAPGTKDDELVQMAIEGLVDCGQDAASETVDTLAVVVRDDRIAAGIRVTACNVLGWLGPDAQPACDSLAAVATGAGATEVRLAAAQALIRVADLDWLALRVTQADHQRDLLSLLRQLGPQATEARRALQDQWKAQPASSSPLAATLPAPAVADATAERLVAMESALARIEKGIKASQAASPEKQRYTVNEVADLTKLSEWTVRQACNKSRIKAEKGPDGQWRIPREELVKIQNEGLPK